MKIYLINLDRSPERLARMQSILRSMGLEFTRFPAVDGSLLTEEELSAKVRLVDGRPHLSLGEIGCTLSHIECLELIAEGPDNYAVIAEDDVHLCSDAYRFLKNSSWIPAGVGVVKLETVLKNTFLGRSTFCGVSGYELRPLLSTHHGSGLYVVSKAAARKIVDLSNNLDLAIDEILFNLEKGFLREINVSQLYPAIAVQDVIVANEAVDYLESGIEAQRVLQKTNRVAPAKPKGVKKLKREVNRIFKRVHSVLHKVWVLITTSFLGYKLGRVPFGRREH